MATTLRMAGRGARCAVQPEPVGGGSVVVGLVTGAMVVVVVVVEVVVVVDVLVVVVDVVVVDVLLVVVVGGGSVDGTPMTLSTSALIDAVALVDEKAVIPIEPATWSAVWSSVTWAVHGAGLDRAGRPHPGAHRRRVDADRLEPDRDRRSRGHPRPGDGDQGRNRHQRARGRPLEKLRPHGAVG